MNLARVTYVVQQVRCPVPRQFVYDTTEEAITAAKEFAAETGQDQVVFLRIAVATAPIVTIANVDRIFKPRCE